ncbi:hypothetical protein BJY01DRAFT_175925 [Aspergillus pseudoustus]|uniref:HD domain-containing protein n=1 Tax=Aspergillus pseudoustus TaxID=1810923 RepID=A0ABR4K4P0_9EURO
MPLYPTRTVAGVPVIDTPLVQAALRYAKTHNDDMSFNHTSRSWMFGCIIATKVPAFADADMEIHAVSAILHDLAWDHTSSFSTPDKRFEVDSANAARDFLAKEAPQLGARQRQIVWDSIALHATPSIALHKEAEVALCQMGITADFLGPQTPGGVITKEEYNAVVAEFPLLDFKEGVKKLMCGLCVHKPETTYDNWVRDFGERFVEGYSIEGKTTADFLLQPIDS